ncbi:hypothetical protein FBU30_009625 [Linnemannia zychae]|nr:hypothetical protein FBU30_009625 [Linnemannia zychae]
MALHALGGRTGGVAVIAFAVLAVVLSAICAFKMIRARRQATARIEQALPGNPISPRPYFAPFKYQPPETTVIDITKVHHVNADASTTADKNIGTVPSSDPIQTTTPPSYPAPAYIVSIPEDVQPEKRIPPLSTSV